MSINRVHRKKHGFSMILNEAAEATNLTWAARGLLWYLLTKPDHWEINTDHLVEQSDTEGKKRLLVLIRELEAAGYIIRWSERGARGRIQWYSEVFESLEDKEEWLKTNNERISNSFSLSKGTSTMHPERSHGQKTKPTMAPLGIDGRADSVKGAILVNTDRTITDSINTDQIKDPLYPPKGDIVENVFSNPSDSEIEELRQNLSNPIDTETTDRPSTLAVLNKDNVPPRNENHSQIIKTGKDVKRALERVKAAKAALGAQAKHNPDAAEAWWFMFRVQALQADCKPGSKAEAIAAWDLLHEIEPDNPELADQIIQGTEAYWERELKRDFQSCKHGVRFLEKRDWQEALEWASIKSASNTQIAQRFSPFLTCWNQDRPLTWPEADETDLNPKCVSRLEEFVRAESIEPIAVFQRALKWCKRDEYWGIKRSLTFEDFLFIGTIAKFAKLQAQHEKLGIGDRVMDFKDLKKAQAELKSKREQVISLRDCFLRGEVTREIFDGWMAKKGLDPEMVLAGNL